MRERRQNFFRVIPLGRDENLVHVGSGRNAPVAATHDAGRFVSTGGLETDADMEVSGDRAVNTGEPLSHEAVCAV
jgi:hypothetical protein